MTTVIDYVTEVLELTHDESEEVKNDYLHRVALEIQKLSEDDWNDMPVELQEWYNETADIIAESGPDEVPELKDLPGAKKGKAKVKKPSKPVVKEAADEDVVEEPAAKEKAPKAKKEPKPKKEKAPKEPRGPIVANAVREILCEDMNTTLDQLMEKLEERGVAMQRSSAQVVHLNTVRAFEVALEVGQVNKGSEVVLKTA